MAIFKPGKLHGMGETAGAPRWGKHSMMREKA